MCAARSAAAWPGFHFGGFRGFVRYTFVFLLSFLHADASQTAVVADGTLDGMHLNQEVVKNLGSAEKTLMSIGPPGGETSQKALMRRAHSEDLDASEADPPDEGEDEDEISEEHIDDNKLDGATDDVNEELESSLMEKGYTRACTRQGNVCRRRRFNLCKRQNCGAAANQFYRTPKSTYHCVGCRNMMRVLRRKRKNLRGKRRGSLTQVSNGASLLNRKEVDVLGHHSEGQLHSDEQVLSTEEMKQMPTDALIQTVLSDTGELCSFRNSFEGCALQQRFFGRKIYRCGKCWRSRWYPKKKPNVFNPYAMRGPPGPPGPPGPSRGKRRRGGRHRRRHRGGRRSRRGRKKRRRRRRSSFIAEDEQHLEPTSGLDAELNEGFSEAS